MKFLLMFLSFCTFAFAGVTIETLSLSPRVYFLPDFLSEKECDHIISLASPHLQRSTVVDEQNRGKGSIDSRRSSEGMFLPYNLEDKIVKRIEKRLADLTLYPVENGESIQVLHYGIGAEYQPHFDFFSENTPGGQSQLDRGGQRVASIIMYLNTPEKGGETIFPRASLSVTPKKGSAVLFYNCHPNGLVDPQSLHGGAPVLAGEKWIATKWIRLNTFH